MMVENICLSEFGIPSNFAQEIEADGLVTKVKGKRKTPAEVPKTRLTSLPSIEVLLGEDAESKHHCFNSLH